MLRARLFQLLLTKIPAGLIGAGMNLLHRQQHHFIDHLGPSAQFHPLTSKKTAPVAAGLVPVQVLLDLSYHQAPKKAKHFVRENSAEKDQFRLFTTVFLKFDQRFWDI